VSGDEAARVVARAAALGELLGVDPEEVWVGAVVERGLELWHARERGARCSGSGSGRALDGIATTTRGVLEATLCPLCSWEDFEVHHEEALLGWVSAVDLDAGLMALARVEDGSASWEDCELVGREEVLGEVESYRVRRDDVRDALAELVRGRHLEAFEAVLERAWRRPEDAGRSFALVVAGETMGSIDLVRRVCLDGRSAGVVSGAVTAAMSRHGILVQAADVTGIGVLSEGVLDALEVLVTDGRGVREALEVAMALE
jgi:hypothetical protein